MLSMQTKKEPIKLEEKRLFRSKGLRKAGELLRYQQLFGAGKSFPSSLAAFSRDRPLTGGR